MRLIALLAALLLAACAMPEQSAFPGRAPLARSSDSTRLLSDELLRYIVSLRAMNEGALAAEASRQKQAAAREATDIARVKAALALTLSPPADEAEVLALVDPVMKRSPGEAELKSVASFLQVIAIDRRRLRESAAVANSRLRDERRAHEALKERSTQLQQKLDALTELEKSLSDRQSTSR